MAFSTSFKSTANTQQSHIASMFTLARWQMRQVWLLLLITCAGMVAAVMITCTVPLFSTISTTAGIRGLFPSSTSAASSRLIQVRASSRQISQSVLQDTKTTLDHLVAQNLLSYVSGPSQFTLTMGNIPFQPGTRYSYDRRNTGYMNWRGFEDLSQLSSHVQLVAGRLPTDTSSSLEIALPASAAQRLQIAVDTSQIISLNYGPGSLELPLHVVGLYQVQNSADPFWNGADWVKSTADLNALIPVQALLTRLSAGLPASSNGDDRWFLPQNPEYSWSYHLLPDRADSSNLQSLQTNLQQFTDAAPNAIYQAAFVENVSVTTPLALLQQYQTHLSVAQVSIDVLFVLIVCLLLFFVSLMAQLLVERQTASFAVLRSRGATQRQLIGALSVQGLGMALLACLAGPPLAVLLVFSLGHLVFPPTIFDLVAPLLTNAWPLLFQQGWLVLVIVAMLLLVMLFSTFQATSLDVLALRRSESRPTHKPFWQRFYLDAFLLLLVAAGYALLQYLLSTGLLDPRFALLFQGPLILAISVFLILAASLVFLRIFPWLLQKCMELTSRGRGAVLVLSLGSMSRVSHYALRMILLLTFTLAFVIFSGTFSASQSQHLADTAAYQVGADFSGSLTRYSTSPQPYLQIPGVKAASLGYISTESVQLQGASLPMRFLAVDPATFIDATLWYQQPALSVLRPLFQQLTSRREALQKLVDRYGRAQPGAASADLTLPAIVDDTTWNKLHLTPGSRFQLDDPQHGFTILALGHVPSIPSINDVSGLGQGQLGMLVDYQSMLPLFTYRSGNAGNFQNTYAWLRTEHDAATLARVRSALSNADIRLQPMYDRSALLDSLQLDPLYINQVGVLATGALGPIILALVGNLLASWWQARQRLQQFAVLRALGISPRQLFQLLFIEQGIIYLTALILGSLFGFVLISLTLPYLVFANITIQNTGVFLSASNIFASQDVPPARLIIPTWFSLAFVALVLICVFTLFLMVRTVTRISASQTLRQNQD